MAGRSVAIGRLAVLAPGLICLGAIAAVASAISTRCCGGNAATNFLQISSEMLPESCTNALAYPRAARSVSLKAGWVSKSFTFTIFSSATPILISFCN